MRDERFDLLTFGEIMLRLSPPNYERMTRGDVFDKRAGGSELNVASGVALLGLRTGVISRLPQNALGTFIKNRIRFEGVSDDYLIYDESPEARLGIYYYENGAAPRKPSIVYDRMNSSITRISLSEIPDSVYTSTRMFHTSGISLALNKNTCEVATEMIKRFRHVRGIEIADADDKQIMVLAFFFQQVDEGWYVRRGMLPICVQGDHVIDMAFMKVFQRCLQSDAFSAVLGMTDETDVVCLQDIVKIIRQACAAIVNDEHMRMQTSRFQRDLQDRALIVIDWDDDCTMHN